MSGAVATAAAAAAPVLEAFNPLEVSIASFNTNPYFIGITMLLLNLGGRFLAMEITKEQEKFFQQTWVRGLLLFVVVFVATRNIIVAFWLSIVVMILLRLLLNENSQFYLLGREGWKPEKFQDSVPTNALTPEEADIYRKLTDKLAKASPTPVSQAAGAKPKKKEATYDILQNYMVNMGRIKV
jgi:hypothetical protein